MSIAKVRNQDHMNLWAVEGYRAGYESGIQKAIEICEQVPLANAPFSKAVERLEKELQDE